jgi:GTP-binding protein
MLRQDLPEDIPTVFISAPTQMGIPELKNIIWRELNSESNKIKGSVGDNDSLVHRDMDLRTISADFAGWEDDDLFSPDEEEDDEPDDDIIYIE